MIDELIFRTRITERADYYDEMVPIMRKILQKLGYSGVDDHVRSLFSIAYKSYIGKRRSSYRLLQQIVKTEEERGRKEAMNCALEYCNEVGEEIVAICMEVERIVQPILSSCTEPVAQALYYKMLGDYKRYIAEVSSERRTDAIEDALKFYYDGMQVGLSQDHHVYLSIALNRAILYYELLDEKEKAIKIVQEALSSNKVTDRKKQPLIVSLLYDNLRLWQS